MQGFDLFQRLLKLLDQLLLHLLCPGASFDHPVKGLPQQPYLVRGAQVGPLPHVPAADSLRHPCQDKERLGDDHVEHCHGNTTQNQHPDDQPDNEADDGIHILFHPCFGQAETDIPEDPLLQGNNNIENLPFFRCQSPDAGSAFPGGGICLPESRGKPAGKSVRQHFSRRIKNKDVEDLLVHGLQFMQHQFELEKLFRQHRRHGIGGNILRAGDPPLLERHDELVPHRSLDGNDDGHAQQGHDAKHPDKEFFPQADPH